MKRLLGLISSPLLLLAAVCPTYRSGDWQEEIRKISIRQYKKPFPFSVINSRKASPVLRAPGNTARGAIQKLMIQKRKSRL